LIAGKLTLALYQCRHPVGRYPSLQKIAETIGIPVNRLDNFMSGEESPTEADLIALKRFNGDKEQLLKDYWQAHNYYYQD